jgi:hypothetical protein|tara:strand:+ start:7027 stop:7251 length:225 start_codon:yes stop_codon:yes gene_type:complete
MADLVERLRNMHDFPNYGLQSETADEIERLRAELRGTRAEYQHSVGQPLFWHSGLARMVTAEDWAAAEEEWRGQ